MRRAHATVVDGPSARGNAELLRQPFSLSNKRTLFIKPNKRRAIALAELFEGV